MYSSYDARSVVEIESSPPHGSQGIAEDLLDPLRRALDVLDACDLICDELPPRRRHVRDQIERAATSVIANTAEGAGEFSPAEKARFYRMARRSAIEVVAWLEITQRRGEAPSQIIHDALTHLEAVVSMLVRLIKRATK